MPLALALVTHRCLELALVFGGIEITFRVCDEPRCLTIGAKQAKSFVTSKNLLLHICDLYDTATCLRILWIFHHCHVQFFLAFAECDVCCAITRGDLKYV